MKGLEGRRTQDWPIRSEGIIALLLISFEFGASAAFEGAMWATEMWPLQKLNVFLSVNSMTFSRSVKTLNTFLVTIRTIHCPPKALIDFCFSAEIWKKKYTQTLNVNTIVWQSNIVYRQMQYCGVHLPLLFPLSCWKAMINIVFLLLPLKKNHIFLSSNSYTLYNRGFFQALFHNYFIRCLWQA